MKQYITDLDDPFSEAASSSLYHSMKPTSSGRTMKEYITDLDDPFSGAASSSNYHSMKPKSPAHINVVTIDSDDEIIEEKEQGVRMSTIPGQKKSLKRPRAINHVKPSAAVNIIHIDSDDDDCMVVEQKPAAMITFDSDDEWIEIKSSSCQHTNGSAECGICLSPFEKLATPYGYYHQEINGWKLSCGHAFCIGCIRTWIKHAVTERTIPLKCAMESCSVHVQPEAIRVLFPRTVPELESIFIRFTEYCLEDQYKAQALYCPNKDCSRLLMMPESNNSNKAYCPRCSQTICVACKVIWHKGFTCGAYQSLPESDRKLEDLQLLKIAQKERWQSCPGCKAMVEKKSGCNWISCKWYVL